MANLTITGVLGLGLAWAGVWGAGVSMIGVTVVEELGILVVVEVETCKCFFCAGVGAAEPGASAWEEFDGWEEWEE